MNQTLNTTKKNNFLENYKDILESFPDGIVLIKESKIVFINKTVSHWVDLSNNDIQGQSYHDWVHPEDVTYVKDILLGNVSVNRSIFNKIRIRSKDLGWICLKIHLQKIEISNEIYFQVILYSESIRDEITKERRRAVKAEKLSKDLALQNAHINSIFNSMTETLIWTMDKDLVITMVNSGFINRCKHFFDFHPKKGDSWTELFKPFVRNENYDNLVTPFLEAFKGSSINFDDVLNDKHGKEFWASIHIEPVIINDEVVEICCIGQIITERKNLENELRQNLEEKDVLLKEIHHRVKNNLQLISSLLNLQSSYTEDEEVKNILTESQNRVKSMAYIHESLYQNKNFASIKFSSYLKNISSNLYYAYAAANSNIKMNLDLDEVFVPIDEAIPCGLIINELLTNSFKYAFPNEKKGDIYISLKKIKNVVNIRVKDNGIGIKKELDLENSNSLGLQIVHTLVEQLNADIELNTLHGTDYFIKFAL